MRPYGLVLFIALAPMQFATETEVSSRTPSASAQSAAAGAVQAAALAHQKRFAEAETAYMEALRNCDAGLTGPCAELPVILSSLGAVNFYARHLQDAEIHLVRALQYWSDGPPSSEDLAAALFNLATVYRTQARYEEALPLYQRALTARERAGELHSSILPVLTILPVLNGMALLYQDTAEYQRAQQVLERAVVIIQSRHAENTPEAASSFAILGTVLEAQGNTREAEARFQQALQIREHLFGLNDTAVADTTVGLALVYQREKRLPEAAELDLRAIAVYRARNATGNLPAALNNLGKIRTEQGQLKEAERLFREAIALWEQQFGFRHPNVSVGLSSLGLLLSSRSKFGDAEAALRRALEIDKEYFQAGHPRIGKDLTNLATLAFDRSHFTEAEGLLLEAKGIVEQRLPPDHPETGNVLARLAEVYHRENRLAQAEPLYRRALQILEQAGGAGNALLLPVLEDFSAVLRAQSNYAEAAALDAKAMKIRVKQTLRSSR